MALFSHLPCASSSSQPKEGTIMGIDDFTTPKNTWIIQTVTQPCKCKAKETITITNGANGVTVTCSGSGHSNIYATGTYNQANDSIEVNNGYKITRAVNGNTTEITCTNPPTFAQEKPTGSWVADDSGTFCGEE
jgi:hypothetical protein